MKFSDSLVKTALWLQTPLLVAVDALVVLRLYSYAWTLREPGWFFFATPLAKLYGDVNHDEWLIVVSLLLAFQIFGLYQLQLRRMGVLILGLLAGVLLQMMFMVQFMTLTRGGPEEFPRSIFTVLALLLLAVVPLYRLPLWLALRLLPRVTQVAEKKAPAPAPPQPKVKLPLLEEMQQAVTRLQALALRIVELGTANAAIHSRLSKVDREIAQATPREIDPLRALRRSVEKDESEIADQVVALKTLFIKEMQPLAKGKQKVQTSQRKLDSDLELLQLKQKLGQEFVVANMEQDISSLHAQAAAGRDILNGMNDLADFYHETVLGVKQQARAWNWVRSYAARSALLTKHFLYSKVTFAPQAVRVLTRDFPTFCLFVWGSLNLVCALFLLASLVMVAEIVASFAFVFLIAALLALCYEQLRHSQWQRLSGGAEELSTTALGKVRPEDAAPQRAAAAAAAPLVSVIILNWDGKEYLANCFDSLYQGTFQDFEIIFSDNASSDGSVEFVREHYPQVRVIENDHYMGITAANNQAVMQARGKYVFFLNNDIIADAHLLEELVRAAEADPAVGIWGCKTVSYHGGELLNVGVPVDLFGYPYSYGEVLRDGEQPFYVDAATFLRLDLFRKLGGFDDRFLIYKEDVDLCWRAWLYGFKVKVVESSWFHHDSNCAPAAHYRTTTQKRFLSEAHTLCMLLKNYRLSTLCLVLPFYFLINLLEILALTFKGGFKDSISIHVKAVAWNIRNLKATWRLRQKVQRERVISDWKLLKRLQKTSGKIALFLQIGLPQVESKASHYVD